MENNSGYSARFEGYAKAKLEDIEKKIDKMDLKMDKLDARVHTMRAKVAAVGASISFIVTIMVLLIKTLLSN